VELQVQDLVASVVALGLPILAFYFLVYFVQLLAYRNFVDSLAVGQVEEEVVVAAEDHYCRIYQKVAVDY
jgi:hypothetical protein